MRVVAHGAAACLGFLSELRARVVEPRFRDAEEGVDGAQQVEQLDAGEGALDVGDPVEGRAEVHEHHVGARPDQGDDGAPSPARRGRRGVERRLGVDAEARAFVAPKRAQCGAIEREDLMKGVPPFGGLGRMRARRRARRSGGTWVGHRDRKMTGASPPRDPGSNVKRVRLT